MRIKHISRLLSLNKLTILFGTVFVLATGGCEQQAFYPEEKPVVGIPQEKMISAADIAKQLGLRVIETTGSSTKLQNSANTVIIFTQPDGKWYVNGKCGGQTGPVVRTDNRVYFHDSLVAQIRSAMGASVPVAPAPQPGVRQTGAVVIDAGHGGKDPGAIGRNGVYESAINLSVAKKVASLLNQRGIKAVLTRSNNSFLELEERADAANRLTAKLFVSLHCDARENGTYRGYTVYTARGASKTSNMVAEEIAAAMNATGLENNGVQRADYRVLVNTNCPAILVEMGCLSNRKEASLLTNDSFQNRIAESLVSGICSTLARY